MLWIIASTVGVASLVLAWWGSGRAKPLRGRSHHGLTPAQREQRAQADARRIGGMTGGHGGFGP
jgi:hypothetical protein